MSKTVSGRADVGVIDRWLFEQALPLWSTRGLDKLHGGPVEQLSLTGETSDAGHKRVRVFFRQLYVFSHAHILGWDQGLAHSEAMFQAMLRHTWQGPQKGWAKTVGSDNRIIDSTQDLYENAFALFSLGWFYKICPRDDVRDLMLTTAQFINTQLRHPKRGFWHQRPHHNSPRLQNPHMHLLEACLVCLESTHEPIFRSLALEVIGLFQNHFYDRTNGSLFEYFDDDLMPFKGDKGQIVEPGHHYEWAWILASAHKLLDIDVDPDVRGLIQFGETFGIDHTTFATYNSVNRDGSLRDSGSRTWPNTERIKAGVALHELFGEDTRAMVQSSLDLLFSRYFATPIHGGWYDAFDQYGRLTATAMPTSTLYHIFLALAEVKRVAGTLKMSI